MEQNNIVINKNPKQIQHWRYYQSRKWTAVNPGCIRYRMGAYQKPLTAYCLFGKHKLILKNYKEIIKRGNRLAVGICPLHKKSVCVAMGKK